MHKYKIHKFFLVLTIVLTLIFALSRESVQRYIYQKTSNNIFSDLPKNNKILDDRIGYKVESVIDGDTIVLEGGFIVRYLYLDTPESKKAKTKIECFGIEAQEFNKKLVNAKEVFLESDGDLVDRYDRNLRLVYLNKNEVGNPEKSVSGILISEGYGRTYTLKDNTKYGKIFYKLQQNSQNDKIGIWGSCERPFS